MFFAQSLLPPVWPRVLLVCSIWACAGVVAAAERPDIAEQLESGRLAEAEQLLTKYLSGNAEDDLARFQLGTVQFLRAAEQLAQDGARYGALDRTMMLPFIRIGGLVSGGPDPERVSYQDVRAMIERFQQGVSQAEATLAAIDDPQLLWDLDLADVRLDLNDDGTASNRETLEVLFRLVGNRTQPRPTPEGVLVGFDSADVYWLRGYCHVLMAMADMILAYDHEELFETTAHAVFADPETKFASLRNEVTDKERQQRAWDDFPDLIAVIHLMDFKLLEPERLAEAQRHLLKMIELSRRSWELVGAETDNHREWIPGANQQSVIGGLAMTRERIDAWHRFLAEAEAVLNGEKLLPFWRSGFEEGVNLAKVFKEPRDFDLVLWVQGTAALPYLEQGETSSPETWQEFQRVFRGEFFGFAAWIN
jgi:hypothetical protein